MKKTSILMILDGYGINTNQPGNAVALASKPNMEYVMKKYPSTSIRTSGEDVGLPQGQMGNSEVGHLNIGAGRIVYQELTRITKDLSQDNGIQAPVFQKMFRYLKEQNKTLHLMGLLSDGGVHSHVEHLIHLLKGAKDAGIQRVSIHCFLDGRDVSPVSGAKYIKGLQDVIDDLDLGVISTVMGRYYAMDRDQRWERTQLAYDAMVNGVGSCVKNPEEVVQQSYEEGITDEFIKPLVTEQAIYLEENDGVIFYNFRPDRARQLTRAIVDENFDGFNRKFFKTHFICLTQYDITMPNVEVAYTPQKLDNTFGEYISGLGLKQLRLAETEKYAHVTFFFNGGVEKENQNEDRILIPSPKIATYDLQPEMSAYLVKDTLIEKLQENKYDVIVVNFANADMVGHTGDLNAAIKAVEAVDKCIGEIVQIVEKVGHQLIITADHGNAEEMLDENKQILTQHTTNPVPLIIIREDKQLKLREGRLADIIPTLLDLMNLEKPKEMTGQSIIVK